MIGNIRATLRVLAFLCAVIIVIPIQGLILLFTKGPNAYHVPLIWHNAVRIIFGIKYEIVGTPEKQRQTLYMSNHLSYLDISILGSILKSSFVAKMEVEGWALFGYLSTLQQTAFINRRRSAIRNEKNSLQKRIEKGESLIIFPEGTSTSGLDVLPFKSSLFSLALLEGLDLYVQPISLTLESVDGTAPTNKEEHDLYAWPRDMDMELGPHLWRFAKSKGAKMRVTFHPPLRAKDFTDRKVLAATCHDHVSKGLSQEKQAA